MSNVGVTLNITVGDKEIKITIEGARELHRQLSELIGAVDKQIPVSPAPQQPWPFAPLQQPRSPGDWTPQWQWPISPTCIIESGVRVRPEHGYEFPRSPVN
jgi:hypothetical protein